MRRILNILPFLLLVLLTAAIAGGQTIPNLTEWYHINSTAQFRVSGPMSYIPNFDTVNGGEHATVMGVGRPDKSGVELWFHRYKEDREPQSGWAGGNSNVTQVDLNGDGAFDYIYSFGRIIQGIKNGLPPEDSMIAQYDWIIGSMRPFTVADLNEDGKQDIIANLNEVGGGRLFSVLVGGPDLKNLKYTLFRRRGEEAFIGLLNKRGEDGTFRLISMNYDEYNNGVKKWTSLILNEMKTWMEGDSLHISLRTLDSISLNTIETGYQFGELQSGIHRAHPTTKEYLIISKYLGNQVWTMVYDCAHDRFDSVAEVRTDNTNLHVLNGDMNGDGYNDWVVRGVDEYLYFYAGQRDGVDTVPLGKYRLPCTDQIDYVHVIGDVNDDGIRDIAVALQPNAGVEGCFAIILGSARRVVGVPEPVTGYIENSFDMQQNYPNPVDSDRKASLPLTTTRTEKFTLNLYTLNGRFIGTLLSGVLPEGTHTLSLDLSAYNLSRGMYVVRLIGSNQYRERAILLD